MTDDDEYNLPPDFASWTADQRADWVFDAESMHEQRWRKDTVLDFNRTQAPAVVVAEPEERPHVFRYEETRPSYDGTGEPLPCPLESERGHWREGCPRCIARRRWATSVAEAYEQERAAVGVVDETIFGDELEHLPPTQVLFGAGERIVSAVGQPWGVFGPDGTGKSTIGQHYTKGRLGIPGWGVMWGMPIEPLPDDRGVLYLALDRAKQIFEGMARGIDWERDRERMHRLAQKKSTLHNLATTSGMAWMVEQVERYSAGLVVIDSRKDIGGTLNADSIEGINALIRSLSNDEVEVLVLGHTREGRRPNGVGPSIEDPSGYREVVSGLGSVIVLEGQPGGLTTDVHHVKPIHELVPPFRVQNDLAAGKAAVLGALAAAGGGGATGGMRYQITGSAGTISGTVPVNAWQVPALKFIDANAGPDGKGWVASRTLMDALKLPKLDRAFKPLVDRGILEHNGQKGPQSAWRRGPNAPAD